MGRGGCVILPKILNHLHRAVGSPMNPVCGCLQMELTSYRQGALGSFVVGDHLPYCTSL